MDVFKCFFFFVVYVCLLLYLFIFLFFAFLLAFFFGGGGGRDLFNASYIYIYIDRQLEEIGDHPTPVLQVLFGFFFFLCQSYFRMHLCVCGGGGGSCLFVVVVLVLLFCCFGRPL